MTILLLWLGVLLLAVIISIAVYGWVTLPPDAHVPVHCGLGSYNHFASKTVGLVTWPRSRSPGP